MNKVLNDSFSQSRPDYSEKGAQNLGTDQKPLQEFEEGRDVVRTTLKWMISSTPDFYPCFMNVYGPLCR